METQVDYGKKTRAGNYDCCILYECGNRGPEPVIPAPETTVSKEILFNIFGYSGRIPQCFDNLLLIVRSRIIKIVIIILQGLFSFRR